jgi:hypothetical protein
MLIKQLWKEFKADFEYQNAYGKYGYSNKEIVNILLLSIFLTPFCLFLDILFSPLELIYLLLLKIIKKKRG